jgi:phosphatidylglycerophosphate synthase
MPTSNGEVRRHRAVTPSRQDSYQVTLGRLSSAQKSAKGAPAYSRFVNRRLGRYLAAAAYRSGLTPNQVTIFSAILSGTGIVLLATITPRIWLGVVVTACLVLGYALDSADGQLARLRGGGSTSGEWLDHVIDATKVSTLHLAVLISTYRYFALGSANFLLVPIGFTAVAAVMFFALILNEQLRRQRYLLIGVDQRPTPADAAPSAVRSLLVAPTDYGVLCLTFLILGWHQVFLVLYTLLFVANAAFLLLALRKWFGQMRELDRPTGVVAPAD